MEQSVKEVFELLKEVFELLKEFKPVSDESEEPVEREWLGKLRRQATKSAMCVAVAYQNRWYGFRILFARSDLTY